MTILGFVFVSTIMRLSHPPKLWYSLTFWEVEWYNLVETVENKHYVHLWRGGGVASHVETVLLSWRYVVVVVGGHWPLSDTSGHHHQVHLRHNTLMTLSLHVSTTYVSSLLHSYVISDHFIYNGTLSVCCATYLLDGKQTKLTFIFKRWEDAYICLLWIVDFPSMLSTYAVLSSLCNTSSNSGSTGRVATAARLSVIFPPATHHPPLEHSKDHNTSLFTPPPDTNQTQDSKPSSHFCIN